MSAVGSGVEVRPGPGAAVVTCLIHAEIENMALAEPLFLRKYGAG